MEQVFYQLPKLSGIGATSFNPVVNGGAAASSATEVSNTIQWIVEVDS